MKALFPYIGITLGIFICLIGVLFIPKVFASHYELMLISALIGQAVFFLLLTRSSKSPYRTGTFSQVLWLFTFTWVAIHLLGGIQFRLNLVLAFSAATLIGTLYNPLHSLFTILLTIFAAIAGVSNRLYGFLPGTTPANIPNISEFVFSIFFPTLSVVLFQVVLLGFKRGGPVTAPRPSVAPESTTALVKGSDQPLAKGSVMMVPDEHAHEEAAASQAMSRLYLETQGEQALKDMKDVLNTVVYFMSKNFKAYTSIGFLITEFEDKLSINSVVTKSRNINYDCLIEYGKGVIGSVVNKPAGFITGNLKSYTGDLEYYSVQEGINSIMIMRIVDNQNKSIQGLLVVDSVSLRAFTDEHKELMYRFTQIASGLITSSKLTDKMRKVAEQADLQYEISKKLSEALKFEEVIEVLTQSLLRSFEHERLIICAYNTATAKGLLWRVYGNAGGLAQGMEFDINNERSLYGSVFRNRRSVMILGFRTEQRYIRFDYEEPAEARPQDILLAPIHDDRQSVWAVVGIESNRPGVYSPSELQLLKTIMANVTTALTKARMYTEMEKLATLDGLTQIANHLKFQDILAQELERSGRYNSPLTLLLLDIDHFKKFNDTYGHPVGDLVLQQVAKALQGSIRTTDYCARYGGEEFVVVLIQADEVQSRILAERIRAAVESLQVQNGNQILRVTVSIGSATCPQDAASKQELIDNADKAMYFSKQGGRNRVSYFSQLKGTASGVNLARPNSH